MTYNDSERIAGHNTPFYRCLRPIKAPLRNSPFYDLAIEWNVREITGSEEAEGYIIQKVRLQSSDLFYSNNQSLITYFEAWRVENGRIAQEEDHADDTFAMPISVPFVSFLFQENETEYKTNVYWVESSRQVAQGIVNWRTGAVPEAGNLKSITDTDFDDRDLDPFYRFSREYKHFCNLESFEDSYQYILRRNKGCDVTQRADSLGRLIEKATSDVRFMHLINALIDEFTECMGTNCIQGMLEKNGLVYWDSEIGVVPLKSAI